MAVLRSVNTRRRVSCLCALTYIPAAAAAQGRTAIPAAKNHVQNATVTAPTINLFGDIKLGGRVSDLGTPTQSAPIGGTNYDQTEGAHKTTSQAPWNIQTPRRVGATACTGDKITNSVGEHG